MRLSSLLDADMALDAPTPDAGGTPISGLTADSRAVVPGTIFAALEGARADGLAFVGQAAGQGAAAILLRTGRRPDPRPDLPLIFHDEPRLALARMAAKLVPGQPETVVAVTGTNGKTSVAAFLRQIWSALGRPAASMGTLGVHGPKGLYDLQHTTPDPVTVHRMLSTVKADGVTHLALEASSHGLAQYRLDGVRIAHAGFTNLTRDHLDYHGTQDAYRDAKARLFTEVMDDAGTAVINLAGAGAGHFAEAARATGRRVLTVGTPQADCALVEAAPRADGIEAVFGFEGRTIPVAMPLYGTFQAQNVAVAIGLLLACGEAFDAVVPLCAQLRGAPGRLERIGQGPGGAPVFVDYAHTPDALENVLSAMRPHVSGRLHVVFGCGGDRDAGKRPEMGAIAARLADHVIVTDDNPRSEDPAAIRKAILAAVPDAREIGDRAEAIAAGLAGLAAGDSLIVAGKGHETGQIVGDRVYPFDDRAMLRTLTSDAARQAPMPGGRS